MEDDIKEDVAPVDNEELVDDNQNDDSTDSSETVDGADETAAEEELSITIDGEPEPEQEEGAAPSWVRDLRKSNREKDRRIRELEAQVTKATPAPQAIVVGPKPKLSDPDIDYDEDKLSIAMDSWYAKKSQADAEIEAKRREEKKNEEVWQSRYNAVTAASKSLKIPDHEEALESFDSAFSALQKGIIIGGPDDPKVSAQARYVLGKNPKVARELAAIQDPVKFTLAFGNLLTKMKVQPKKSAPPPERVIRSNVPGAAAVDNQLEKLRAEAAKTGDMTKVHQYKQQLRNKSRG